ncbi:amidohydrolase [Paenibacillus sp. PK3_47]|uniref:amidohydrolase n=1 Tax=Paenibacillus sp. PK3_47 TaxID=2072642 RepID=UPI00201D89C1|nr:amidohydrolase [Paenibacillus sp. PK3_47]UQZ35853.1 amidohydrolase [Paenibacillus sp. PK3_47]
MSATLFKNGILPFHSHQAADAVYVENGVIAAVGESSELALQLSGTSYSTVDWDGAYVLPGLTDAHVHLGMHGMKLDMLDFTGMTSREEMLGAIRKRAEVTPPGEWILGLNWNENEFRDMTAPHISELDEVTDRHPVFLTRTCFHAFLGNSEAFRRAGVSELTPDFASGAYGRDTGGRLNGWIYEDAAQPFNAVQPAPGYAAKKEAVRRGITDALSLGLTAVHTEDLRLLDSVETMLRIHRELREEGLFFRTHQLMYYSYLQEMEALGLKAGYGDEWLRIGAVKLFADGAIGGRTALLEQPYSDAPDTCGIAIHPQEGLNEIVAAARRQGFPVAVHAIGDAAARMTLAAMEHSRLPMNAALPDRFIHAQVLNAERVQQMSRMRLIADIQPRFVASDFPWVLERVGPARTGHLYAWKKLLDAGIICAGGSDAPIEPISPFLGLHAAVTRRKPGESHGGYLPEEKLDIREALGLFTTGSALAAGEEQERGRIAPGQRADFTVIDRDICMDAEELLKVNVRMTVVNGVAAYTAG